MRSKVARAPHGTGFVILSLFIGGMLSIAVPVIRPAMAVAFLCVGIVIAVQLVRNLPSLPKRLYTAVVLSQERARQRSTRRTEEYLREQRKIYVRWRERQRVERRPIMGFEEWRLVRPTEDVLRRAREFDAQNQPDITTYNQQLEQAKRHEQRRQVLEVERQARERERAIERERQAQETERLARLQHERELQIIKEAERLKAEARHKRRLQESLEIVAAANNGTLDVAELDRGRYPSDWNSVRQAAYTRDRYTCQNCELSGAGVELHAHHIVPLSRGGTNKMSNLKTLCADCHRKVHGA